MVYLQICLDIAPANRAAAASVYARYRAPFLAEVKGAKSKELLVREEDVQVLHAFDAIEHVDAYLASALFTNDVVSALTPFLQSAPVVRIYTAA